MNVVELAVCKRWIVNTQRICIKMQSNPNWKLYINIFLYTKAIINYLNLIKTRLYHFVTVVFLFLKHKSLTMCKTYIFKCGNVYSLHTDMWNGTFIYTTSWPTLFWFVENSSRHEWLFAARIVRVSVWNELQLLCASFFIKFMKNAAIIYGKNLKFLSPKLPELVNVFWYCLQMRYNNECFLFQTLRAWATQSLWNLFSANK